MTAKPTAMKGRNRNRFWRWALLLVLTGGVLARPAAAAPVQRYSVEARGDFVLFGNTLAQECGPGAVAPVSGTVGACGTNTADSAPDIFWQADIPAAGQAVASTSATAAQASSTAVLNLPQGATVLYARLYWAARQNLGTDSASFERPGTFAGTVSSDVLSTISFSGTIYQRSADVTALVQTYGAGAYRVGGIDSISLANRNDSTVFAGWHVVVMYRLDTLPRRSMTLHDGLDLVIDGSPLAVTLGGFRVPAGAVSGKLGIVAYEGDDQSTGDSLSVNGTLLADAVNAADNFFNSSRSLLGAAESHAGDLPQLSGAPRSLSGLDLDVVDVSALLSVGATSLNIQATTVGDAYVTGTLVTAIATVRPDLSNFQQTVRNLSRSDGSFHPGDEVEYVHTLASGGTDSAVEVQAAAALPLGLTFQKGSLELSSGANFGSKSDESGDDQAEYDAAARTVNFRLGQGAGASQGGILLAGDPVTTWRFRARIDAGVSGAVLSQATVRNQGANSVSNGDMSVDTWLSGDGTTAQAATVFTVTPGQNQEPGQGQDMGQGDAGTGTGTGAETGSPDEPGVGKLSGGGCACSLQPGGQLGSLAQTAGALLPLLILMRRRRGGRRYPYVIHDPGVGAPRAPVAPRPGAAAHRRKCLE